MDRQLETLFTVIDDKKPHFIFRLAEAVSHQSVGGSPNLRQQCLNMVQWTKKQLEAVGGQVQLFEMSTQQKLNDNVEIEYPPVVLASFGNNPAKATICVFGHLDVQSAEKVNDGWETEPFQLTEINGNLYGRGTSDDKGAVCAWINCLEAYKSANIELPVNVNFIFDCLEGSETLESAIKARPDFFEKAAYICISDNHWITRTKPCLTYGLRGISYFMLTVECAQRDLHSGVNGGAVHEAMWDLMALMDSLVKPDGTIAIPGVMDLVEPERPEEQPMYENIDFDVESYWKLETGAPKLLNDAHLDKTKLLRQRWRLPAISLHGVEGDFSDSGAKTVIPRRVVGKFSIRLVPNQDPQEIERLVRQHLETEFAKRNSPNKWALDMVYAVKPWMANVEHVSYEAARRAIKKVWNVEPDLTREGGTAPAALTFETLTGKSVLLLPIGQSDDGAHSNHEKISVDNYINGAKLFGAFFEMTAAAVSM